MPSLMDKERNILSRVSCLIKDIFVDIVEGNLTKEEKTIFKTCIVVCLLFIAAGVSM